MTDELFMCCPRCNGSGLVENTAIPGVTARWGDPDTSQAARKDSRDIRVYRVTSVKARALRALFEAADTAQGAAIRVIGDGPVSAIEGCRRRVNELAAAGHVRDSGRRRVNPGSRDESIVWEVTAEGRAVLSHLDETGVSL